MATHEEATQMIHNLVTSTEFGDMQAAIETLANEVPYDHPTYPHVSGTRQILRNLVRYSPTPESTPEEE